MNAIVLLLLPIVLTLSWTHWLVFDTVINSGEREQRQCIQLRAIVHFCLIHWTSKYGDSMQCFFSSQCSMGSHVSLCIHEVNHFFVACFLAKQLFSSNPRPNNLHAEIPTWQSGKHKTASIFCVYRKRQWRQNGPKIKWDWTKREFNSNDEMKNGHRALHSVNVIMITMQQNDLIHHLNKIFKGVFLRTTVTWNTQTGTWLHLILIDLRIAKKLIVLCLRIVFSVARTRSSEMTRAREKGAWRNDASSNYYQPNIHKT